MTLLVFLTLSVMVRPVELLAQQHPMEIAPPKGLQLTTREAFEQALRAYEERYLTDARQLERIRRDLMQGDLPAEEITDELVRSYARQEARQRFIHAYTKQYLELYFPVTASMDTLADVCDNGGFEEDFKYYEGYVGLFKYGSNDCDPHYGSRPTFFTRVQMPVAHRFEIMTVGSDPLVDTIDMVKFGQQALRLNDKFGHGNSKCWGYSAVDRIVKRFVVTEENREFTVWYAVILENPQAHVNRQPFFSIRCNLAPDRDLCFDANLLKAGNDRYLHPCPFEKIKALDWSCHRIIIPRSEIGKVATLEITAADCGQSGHIGYAYIDGICEPCDTTSATGSVDIHFEGRVCGVPRICGTFSYPNVGSSPWQVKEITIPGYTVENLKVSGNTFCMDFPLSNFKDTNCLEVYAEITFVNSDGDELPSQLSDLIEVCKDSFYLAIEEVIVGGCNDNGTAENISDDYYFVTVKLDNPSKKKWLMMRRLDDPYPNESATHTIMEGMDDGYITIGPFLIQEGSWRLLILWDSCELWAPIIPPPYCSGCDQLHHTILENVECLESGQGGAGQWTFDITVPGSGGTYEIYKENDPTPIVTAPLGTKTTVGPLDVMEKCLEFRLEIPGSQPICYSNFIVCPPKPCGGECGVEARIAEYTCSDLNNGSFYVKLDATNTSVPLCYKVWKREDDNTRTFLGSGPYPSNHTFGPFGQGFNLEFSIFPCNFPSCFKMLYVPYPGICKITEPYTESEDVPVPDLVLEVIPNPFTRGRVLIKSPYARTEIVIYNMQGNKVYQTTFEGDSYRLPIALSRGVYLLRYKTPAGQWKAMKLIRL